MKKGRGNPTASPIGRKVLSQQVVNPVGNEENTDTGTPGKLRGGVKQNPARVISQRVLTPSAGDARGKADVVKKLNKVS